MILVVSILVLLVIIATAFVSRTQGGRVTASAQQQAAAQTDRVGPIAHAVTDDISQALFVKPVNPTDPSLLPPGTGIASSAYPRLSASMDIPVQGSGFIPGSQTRFGVDPLDTLSNSTLAIGTDGIVDGYNYAPYEVRPWTNWPDLYNASPAGDIRSFEGNPVGNPGFGDARWLRSTEPVRVVFQGSPAFSHWAHLSWIPSSNNGWRLVTDISNVAANTLTLVAPVDPAQFFATPPARYGLQIPYEQWLPSLPPDPTLWIPTTLGAVPPAPMGPFPNPSTPQGDAALTFQQLAFGTTPVAAPQGGWFSSAHAEALGDQSMVLPNFLRLKWFGPKGDEFIKDSPRNIITRTLCDTDGDGFTDSFWFLAPTSLDRSVRHLVGVSVVDNCALLNVNIATRSDSATTGGTTPSDLALVGRQNSTGAVIPPPGASPQYSDEVGFLSTALNTAGSTAYSGVSVNFQRERFGAPTTTATIPGSLTDPTLLRELGIVKEASTGIAAANPAFPNFLKSGLERVRFFKAMSIGGAVDGYFNAAGVPVLRSASGSPAEQLDPFSMADELELRAFTGHNNPYLRTRLERAIDPDTTPADQNFQFLRSSMAREETSEYFDQLDARQLLFDNRRKITTVSAARNDLMPPWLWTLPPAPAADPTTPWTAGQVRSWKPLYQSAYGILDVSAARSVPPQGTPDLAKQFPAQPGADTGDGNCDGVVDQTDVELARSQFLSWNRKVDLNRELFDDHANAQQFLMAQHDFGRDVMKVLQRSLLDVDTRTSVFGSEIADLDKARRACASWTANILAARDGPRLQAGVNVPTDPPLHPERGIIIEEGATTYSFVGEEKHPFIVQVFFAVVYPKTGVVPPGVSGAGSGYVCYSQQTSDPARIVLAVQIANPYNEPIELWPFQLRAFGQTFQFLQPPTGTDGRWGYGFSPVLGPATEEGPRSAVVFAIPKAFDDDPNFRARMMAMLDLTHPWITPSGAPSGAIVPQRLVTEIAAVPVNELFPTGGTGSDMFEDPMTVYADTLLFNASRQSGGESVAEAGSNRWDLHPKFYYDKLESANHEDSDIALIRLVADPYNPSSSATIVVDRFENEFSLTDAQGGVEHDNHPWREELERVLKPPPDPTSGGGGTTGPSSGAGFMVPPTFVPPDPGSATQNFARVDIGGNDFLMTWARSSRPWALDVDGDMAITANERSPRFVFASNSKPVVSQHGKGGPEYVGMLAGATSEFPGIVFTAEELKTEPDKILMSSAKTPFGNSVRGKPTNFTLRTQVVGVDRVYTGWPMTPSASWPGIPGGALPPTEIYGDTGAGVPTLALDFYRHPLRLTQREGAFEQVAEILDVPVWGPVMKLDGGAWKTHATAGEMMIGNRNASGVRKSNTDPNVHFPSFTADATDERDTTHFLHDRSRDAVLSIVGFVPLLPAGASILDGFTIDGAGVLMVDADNNLTTTDAERLVAEQRRLRLSGGFAGTGTPGLVNINTAPIEVMRALPHMQQLSYDIDPVNTGGTVEVAPGGAAATWRVRLPETIVNYRDRLPAANGFPDGPKYDDRGFVPATGQPALFPFHPQMRRERGIVSVGELALMDREYRPSDAGTALEPDPEEEWVPGAAWSENKSWSIAYAGRDPYRGSEDPPVPSSTPPTGHPPLAVPIPSDSGLGWRSGGLRRYGAQLATERSGIDALQYDFINTPAIEPAIFARTSVAGDVSERNALLKGIANMVTSRSDIFTVYLRVRAVAPDPATGAWDGTSPSSLLEESRYVMVVDRSLVNRPGEEPKILMFEKVLD